VAAGLGRGAIAHRIARGRLHPLYRGVYLLGHSLLLPLAREQAALLACGVAALLSHRSAAFVWRMPVDVPSRVEVTLVGCARRQRAGLRIHRVPTLHPDDIRRHQGLLVTAPARTLLDLAALLPPPRLEQVVGEALALHLVSMTSLHEALARSPRRHGASSLRALLALDTPPAHTRSEGERLMLALVRRHGLPEPATNVQIEEWNVDFLWRDQGLVVEVDGYGFHSSLPSFERDHLKDAALQDQHALTLRRVTYRQLRDHPDETADNLKSWLSQAPRAAAA
jgi:very-short-patch-repair endonuclease